VPKPVDDDAHATLTLTIPETAELLGISLSKAYEAARLGQIPTFRLGTRILVSRRRLEEMVNAWPK
jgi:excisionase family DNA binding protein